jgi:N-acetylmuramoyl-L-alanine amidase
VGPPTRAIIEVTPPAPVTVASDAGRTIVRIDADALDLTLPAGGGLIEQIRAGDQLNTVALVLGGGAGTPRTATITSDGAARVMIDVPAAAGGDTAAATPPAPSPPTDTLPVGTPRPRFALIAIDPGHGGGDIGVKTSDGLEEKELTLDVARRVRQRLETRLGVRAILTRDEDKALTLDERAAFANNSKADLFLSLHANGALGPGVTGAEVFFLSLDREGETVRRTATAAAVSLPVLGGGRRLVEVVPWNLAQAAYIDGSAKLAGMLEEELRRRVPMSPRAVQRAAMRVLTGANMPAALVEMAYLTNRDQAGKARGDDFRNAVADAVYEAIARFRAAAIEKPTP